MDKMPDHISDETGQHINDPQDAPNAIDKEYDVFIPFVADVIVTVTAENEIKAIEQAKKQFTKNDFYNIEWKTENGEVIER